MTRYVFLDDGAEPMLFFACSREDASDFARWLRAIGEQGNVSVLLDETQGFRKRGEWIASLEVQLGAESHVTIQRQTRTLIWTTSPEAAERAASLIQGILESEQPGHNYLEDAGHVVIQVSVDEFSSPVWKDQLRTIIGNDDAD